MISFVMDDPIRIRGARQHNLKGIDLDLPRRQFTVITGPSGSGKSSLALDTLFAEGQRHLNQLAFAAIQHGHPLSGDHLYALLSALSEKNQAL